MPSTAAQINDLTQQLGQDYSDKSRLKADVKRLLGLVDGTWLTTLLSREPSKPRPWMLNAEIGFWGTGNRMKLTGHVTPYPRDRGYRVPIVLWLPPEYPNGYPALFIVPARHTRLVQGHPNVGQDGMFYHPYISTWNTGHTLEELLGALISVLQARPALEDTTLQDLTAGVVSSIFTLGNRLLEGVQQAQQQVIAVTAAPAASSSTSSTTNTPAPSAPPGSPQGGLTTVAGDVGGGDTWVVVPEQHKETDTPATEPGTECIVCLENTKCAFFLPCGHVACCMKCGRMLKECCICRTPIEKMYKAFV